MAKKKISPSAKATKAMLQKHFPVFYQYPGVAFCILLILIVLVWMVRP